MNRHTNLILIFTAFITKVCNGPVSAFDSVDFNSSASAPSAAPAARKVRPSITVDDADAPSVSFAAAKPMTMGGRKGSEALAEEAPEATFTLKAPRRSSSIVPPDA